MEYPEAANRRSSQCRRVSMTIGGTRRLRRLEIAICHPLSGPQMIDGPCGGTGGERDRAC